MSHSKSFKNHNLYELENSTANFGSALAIELRRGAPPESREFLRFQFKNGSSDFQMLHAFGHHADIPLTEFVYRVEVGP